MDTNLKCFQNKFFSAVTKSQPINRDKSIRHRIFFFFHLYPNLFSKFLDKLLVDKEKQISLEASESGVKCLLGHPHHLISSLLRGNKLGSKRSVTGVPFCVALSASWNSCCDHLARSRHRADAPRLRRGGGDEGPRSGDVSLVRVMLKGR